VAEELLKNSSEMLSIRSNLLKAESATAKAFLVPALDTEPRESLPDSKKVTLRDDCTKLS
jgi:hypothetical protein